MSFLLSDIVNTIPYATLKGIDCYYENLHCFFKTDEYILQKIFSSGGDSTYRITQRNTTDTEEITCDKNGDYMLSPFLPNSLSLNTHVLITENGTFVFPASIQIICEHKAKFLYSGADFICFQQLSDSVKHNVFIDATKIAKFLQKKGYRGIAGIDFLLHENQLYFMEINPRFQASSDLVNRKLCETEQKSLQELHLIAFGNKLDYVETNIDINYSNFVYTSNNISRNRIKKVLDSKELSLIQLDGYSTTFTAHEEENAYLFRCVLKENICTLKKEKLLLHPNIYTEEIKPYVMHNTEDYKENVKFALLNHGVTLSKEAAVWIEERGIIREAVFDAIDITIFDHIRVNVPYSCKFSSISPFTIDVRKNKLVLLFDSQMIANVQIDLLSPKLLDKKATSGVPFSAIFHFATDRIRINPAPVCIYKVNNTPCHFCNFPKNNYKYTMDDIKEVIDYCLENIDFRHFLIGGGTYSLEGGWEIILQITKYIRKKCSKDIYLMAVPPKDIAILDALKAAGITEVAFNLEIFDRHLARQIMPGKGKIPLHQYTEAFSHAVSLWGKTGKVRSLLIYGFDIEEVFCKGLEDLCRIGVEPIISIFRPLSGTQLSSLNPPATVDIFSIYKKCKEITAKYSLKLGPDCPDCQNNTLSFSE